VFGGGRRVCVYKEESEEKSLPVEQALRHPGFFAFHIELQAHQLRRSDRFDIYRQGLDVDVITLAGS
jgi:hypothetical protein